MNYVAVYRIDVNHGGVTAEDIRTAVDKTLQLEGTQGLTIPGKDFTLGVAYDLLQVGGGHEGEARAQHIREVGLAGLEVLAESDILLRIEPQTAIASDLSRYTSLAVKVTIQGAKSVTPDVIEKVKLALSGQ